MEFYKSEWFNKLSHKTQMEVAKHGLDKKLDECEHNLDLINELEELGTHAHSYGKDVIRREIDKLNNQNIVNEMLIKEYREILSSLRR